MALQSDLTLDKSKFDPVNIPPELPPLNDGIIKAMEDTPKWYEVGAEKYRQMRWNNETPLPRPPVIESGRNETIPSRDKGRDIPVRTFVPESGKPKGVFLHIHGGGWTLQSEHYQDTLLNFMSQTCSLTVVSIGYRLAPEHPYPAGPEDCYDAAEYLVSNSQSHFGCPLLFMGGESAGAHLSALAFLHLRKTHPSFRFKGLILHFGVYAMSPWLPSVIHFNKPLIIDRAIMDRYHRAFIPDSDSRDMLDPSVSPFYADWMKMGWREDGGLPPALFTCGTEDPLVDDSVLMAAKWQMAGGEGVLKIYPGAPHGFVFFDSNMLKAAEECYGHIEAFLKKHLE